MKGKIFYLLFSFFIAALDLLLKLLIKIKINNLDGLKIFNGAINILYLENKGAAFGILAQNKLFLIFMSSIFTITLIYVFLNKNINNKILLTSLALIIGGGLGNLINRAWLGYVIDYIKLSFFEPVFNFADCCLTLGALGMIFYIIFYNER